MRLNDIKAEPHSSGNRIDVSWGNPDAAAFPGVRVVRREKTHPVSADDGIVVAEGLDLPFTTGDGGERLYDISDTGLKGETVYYYGLFPYESEPADYQADSHNRASAMATASYDMAGQMYQMLPALYHRYDAAESNGDDAPLRRFLDLPGSQLDMLYSFARAGLNLYDIERVDGRLLQLLAQWIGWNTNYRLDVGTQRNELRAAPHLYKTIGIVPTVEATVKRVLGWESQAKEFVHNVALSNSPEKLNMWTLQRGASGQWQGSTEPLSLDFAYEGRPAAARDENGVLWLFYHTLRNGRWDIWYKTLTTFTIPTSLQEDLDRGVVTSDLMQAFEDAGFILTQETAIENVSNGWMVAEPQSDEIFNVRDEDGVFMVYRWTPSARLTNTRTVDKRPAVLYHDATLYVFWDSFDPESGKWTICRRTYSGGAWSAVENFGDDGVERKSPSILVDHTEHLWAFWLEKENSRWQLKYARQADGGEWNLEAAHVFPDDGGAAPRVDSEVFAFFQPSENTPDATPRIWVFWTRKADVGGGQTRWQIAYRVGTGIDPNEITWIRWWSEDYPDHLSVDTSVLPVDISFRTWYVNKPLDWGAILTIPDTPEDFSAREPAAFINPDGELELFYSSDDDGSWSVWRTSLTGVEPPTWETPERLTTGPYAQRAPFPATINSDTLVFYRSNESVRYASEVYRATETLDARYAGSTTVDSRNAAKISLRERFQDFQTYSYDVGKGDRNWYARDTVGIYLNPDTDDQNTIVRNRNLITNILRQFMPAQTRVVFVIPIITRESFYTYDLSDAEPQRVIIEQYADNMTAPSSELYGGVGDEYTDTMVGWQRAYSWSEEHTENVTVDTAAESVDTSLRTWHVGVEVEE